MTADSELSEPRQRETADESPLSPSVQCTIPEDFVRALGKATTLASPELSSALSLFLSVKAPQSEPGENERSPEESVTRNKDPRAEAAPGEQPTATEPLREGPHPRLAEIAKMTQPGRYDEIDFLGAGGMGVVTRVFDRVLGREAAMKVLESQRSGTIGTLRFLEEAQITGQLDHPGVVPVHDFGVEADGSKSYFTMKLVRGESLAFLIATHHKFGLYGRPLERLLGAFTRVCEAIAFAHSRRVIHRDLKPDNILIGSHGQVYVMDWGLAIVLNGGRPSETVEPPKHEIAGTPSFMAPEQAHGHVSALSPRTDIFGLGAMLYAILTGKGPHHAATSIASLEKARKCVIDETTLEDAPPELARITMKALSPDPEDRYASAEELGQDIEAFLRGGGWFRTRTYAAGETIIAEGEPGSVAYVLATGRCEVFKTVDGQKVPLRVLEPGDVFGETAVFTAKPRSATVVALEPCSVKIVTRDALDRELDRNPWMGAFVRAVAERFREADAKLVSIRPATSE